MGINFYAKGITSYVHQHAFNGEDLTSQKNRLRVRYIAGHTKPTASRLCQTMLYRIGEAFKSLVGMSDYQKLKRKYSKVLKNEALVGKLTSPQQKTALNLLLKSHIIENSIRLHNP